MRTSKQILVCVDPIQGTVRVVDCDTDEEYLKYHKPEPHEIGFFHDRGSLPSPIGQDHVHTIMEHYKQKAKEQLNKNKQQ